MILFDNSPKNKIVSNKKFEALNGYLDEETAKISLAEFLYNNIGIACELLLGYKLFPFQEIILREWFDHNFNYFVASRGGSKSTLAAIFCILYPIFHPNTKIVLSSNTFRSTRRILTQIEKFLNGKGAILAKQCFTDNPKGRLEFAKRADEMIMQVNGGSIVALPLNEKIRGTRADILICDEFLQIPEDIYKSVLVPFLASKNNIQEQLAIQEEENDMIASGLMTEDQRTVLESDKKILVLSSASYDFDFAYRLFREWCENIENPKKKQEKQDNRSYFALRLSYLSLPKELVEKEIADEVKSGGEGTAAFEREWMAKFSSSSDGFFNIKKLHECTVKPGDFPHVQLVGDPKSSYCLALDPSFSDSKSSDFFAMGVYLLNSDTRTITLVHSYGKPGTDLKEHIAYLHYLVSSFNIVFLIADLGGNNVNFIETCNESKLFKGSGVNLKFITGDFDEDDYANQCQLARNSYNLNEKRFCYRQKFNAPWLQKANEHLQTQISMGKIWFASNYESHEDLYTKTVNNPPAMLPGVEDSSNEGNAIIDFISNQDEFIDQTKRQIALIEPSITGNGTMQFNLPRHMRNSKKAERARKDNYTCLLLACWGAKCYWDVMYKTEESKEVEWFIPRFI